MSSNDLRNYFTYVGCKRLRLVARQHYIGIYSFSFYFMREADYRAFHDGRMLIYGVLHLCCANSMSAYIEDIIHTTGYPVHANTVSQGSVSGKVIAWIGRKISTSASLMVSP